MKKSSKFLESSIRDVFYIDPFLDDFEDEYGDLIEGQGNTSFFGMRYNSSIGCSFFGTYDDGTLSSMYQAQSCHASVHNIGHHGKVDKLYTSLWFGREDCYDACIEWIEWFTSSDSPWYKAAKGCEILYDDENRPVCLVLNTYSDPDCPAALFVNILHCSRMVYEQPGMIKYWSYLRSKYRMTPERALVYALHFKMHKEGHLTSMFEMGHTVLTRRVRIDVEAMEKSKPSIVDNECLLDMYTFPANITKMWDKETNGLVISRNEMYPPLDEDKFLTKTKDGDVSYKFHNLIEITLGKCKPKRLCPDKIKTDYMDMIYESK